MTEQKNLSEAIALPRVRAWKDLTGGQQNSLWKAVNYFKRFLDCRAEGAMFPCYNIISIEGGRGAGKTTLLKTFLFVLRYICKERGWFPSSEVYGDQEIANSLMEGLGLKSNRSKEINKFPFLLVLDPVDPDLFNGGKAETILTWIFQNIQRRVNELVGAGFTGAGEKIRQLHEEVSNKRKELNEALALVAGDYLKHAITLSATRWDFAHEINQAQRSSWQLKECIDDYLFCLSDYISRFLGVSTSDIRDSARFPRIVIPIDDVDMAGRRAADLLQMVTNYLNHPNLLVVLMGDRGAFQDAIKEKLFAYLPKALHEDMPFRSRRLELASNILDKALLPEVAVRIEDSSLSLFEQIVYKNVWGGKYPGDSKKRFDLSNVLIIKKNGGIGKGKAVKSSYINLFRTNIRRVKALAYALADFWAVQGKARLAALGPLLDLLMSGFELGEHGPGGGPVSINEAAGQVEVDVSRMAQRLDEASWEQVLAFCFLHDLLRKESWTLIRTAPLDRESVALAFNTRLPIKWLQPRDLPPTETFLGADHLLYNANVLFLALVEALMAQVSTGRRDSSRNVLFFLVSEEGGMDPVGSFLVKGCLYAALLVQELKGGCFEGQSYDDFLGNLAKKLDPGKDLENLFKFGGRLRYFLEIFLDYLKAESHFSSHGYEEEILGQAQRYIKGILGKFKKLLGAEFHIEEKELRKWLKENPEAIRVRLGDWRKIASALAKGYLRRDMKTGWLELTTHGEGFIRQGN